MRHFGDIVKIVELVRGVWPLIKLYAELNWSGRQAMIVIVDRQANREITLSSFNWVQLITDILAAVLAALKAQGVEPRSNGN